MKHLKKKLFVVQPIWGINEEEVYAVRMSILKTMGEDEYELLYNYKYTDAPFEITELWHLGRSIQHLDQADVVVFAPGWRNDDSCRAVFDICNIYGLPFIDFEQEYL